MKACFLLVAAALAVPLKSAVLPFGPDLIADYTTFAVKHVHSLAVVGEAQALSIAAATAADLGVSPSDMRVTWSYKSDIGLNHVYMVQTLNGLDIVNAVMNVNLDAYGQKLSIGSTLFKPAFSEADMGSNEQINLMARTVLQKPVKTPTEGLNALLMHVSLETAVISSIVETQGSWVIIVSHPVKATVPVKLAYLTGKDRNSVKLVYDLEIDLKDNWYSAQVDAVTGEVLNMVDYVSHSTFNVYPVGQNDPGTGKRSLLKDPENLLASPLGWNARIAKNKLVDYSTTYGNNVYASDNPTGGDDDSDNFRPDGGPHHNFDFPINFKKEPDTYLSAAITNLFYWNNIMHDLFCTWRLM